MINKLKTFVQKALNLPKTAAIIQVGNSRKETAHLNKMRNFLEFFGITVEWYYFESNIKAQDLIFEIENLKPFVDKIILYPSDIVERKKKSNFREELKKIIERQKLKGDK